MKLERVVNVGKTPFGNRQVAVVQDGALSGARLSGSVMTGALDLELILSNGVIEIEQQLVLKTNDGKYIYVHAAGTGADASDVRVVMDFEAPNASDFAWLNSGQYVARRALNGQAKTMTTARLRCVCCAGCLRQQCYSNQQAARRTGTAVGFSKESSFGKAGR